MNTGTPDQDWWYVRAYPGRLDLLDEATRVLLPWLHEQAVRENAANWFFTRYLDMTGQHLRLRLRCSAAGVDRLHDRLPEVTGLVEGIAGSGSEPRLVPASPMFSRPGPRKVRASLYSPELVKYGGRAGVEVAEEHLTNSTLWYLRNDVASLDQSVDRAALAVRYLRLLVGMALPDRQPEFWTAHRRQWGWQLRSAAPNPAEFTALTRQAVQAIGSSTGVHDDLIERLTGYAAGVVGLLDRAGAMGNPVSRDQLLLHYLHMDLNRWGFLPAEECLLGLIAAPARVPSR
jgi:hypothetical protein